jgi:hypothetical protein
VPTVLFVSGWGRSGSTLLERMLDQVPGVVAAGETWNLWSKGMVLDQLCSCAVPVRSCPFWTEVAEVAWGGFDEIDGKRAAKDLREVARIRSLPLLGRSGWRRGGAHDRQARMIELYRQLYDGIAAVSGASVVVDTSKNPQLGFLLRHVPGIDVVVLHLVRDSRAVAYSWRRVRRKPEVVDSEQFITRYGPRRSAVAWTVANLLTEVLRIRSSRSLRLRYEDLVQAPEEALRRVLEPLGLGDRSLAFLEDHRVVLGTGHSGAGNPVRFNNGPVDLVVDDGWRSETGWAPLLVTAMTAPLLRYYGYRLRR